MRVVEAGHDRAAPQVEDARLRADEGQHLGLGAHRCDAVRADGHRLRARTLRVHGVDDRVRQDEVGRRGGGRDERGESKDPERHGRRRDIGTPPRNGGHAV